MVWIVSKDSSSGFLFKLQKFSCNLTAMNKYSFLNLMPHSLYKPLEKRGRLLVKMAANYFRLLFPIIA